MPAATVTLTVTAAVTACAAVATTRTVCAPPSSVTPVTAAGVLCPSSKVNVMSSSSSLIFKLAVFTSKGMAAPVVVPENRMVSFPSTSESSTGVIVKAAAACPVVSPLLIVTVVVPDEAE